MKHHGLWSVREDGLCFEDFTRNDNKEATQSGNGGLVLFLGLSFIFLLVLASTFRQMLRQNRLAKIA